MRKRIYANLMVVLIVFSILMGTTDVYAYSETTDNLIEWEIFKCPDGTEIEYFIGEDGNPYVQRGVNYVPIALPLPQYRVVDESTLSVLNSIIPQRSLNMTPYTPDISSAFDLSNCLTSEPSDTYVHIAYLDNGSQYDMVALKINFGHRVARLRTTNLVKKHFWSGNLIDFRMYLYESATHTWDSLDFSGWDCTGTLGGGIEFVAGVYSYISFSIKANSDIESLYAKVFTTPIGYY